MTYRFAEDTAVNRLDSTTFEARIDPGWWIINGPNGGYIAAILLRAMQEQVDPDRAPRSLTVHYLRPPSPGRAVVVATLERSGRSVSTLTARLLQDDRLMCLAMAIFAGSRRSFELEDLVPPSFPPPEDCQRLRDKLHGAVEMQNRYDSRWAVGSAPGAGGDEAVCGGWIRLDDGGLVDAPLVAAYTDAFPPAVFGKVDGRSSVGPVPTLDLTIHFRASLPRPGAQPEDFCKVLFRSRLAREGFVEEDGEVWSAGGVLLAQSRQLALLAPIGG